MPLSAHWLFLKSLDISRCCFIHRHRRAILRTYSESFPDISIDTNVSSLQLSLAEKSLFIFAKNDSRDFCQFLAPGSSFRIVCATLNYGCSAEDRLRELKLASIEPPCYEDSEYVLIISLWCLWMNRHWKTSKDTIYYHSEGPAAVGQNVPQG
jgi:hypothetical protein